MILDRAALLALKSDLPREEISLGDGRSVYVRTMTAAERDRFESEHRARADKHHQFRARFAAAVLCDAAGAPLFTADDIPQLGELPSTLLDAVVEAGMRLNGMGDAAARATEKNS